MHIIAKKPIYSPKLDNFGGTVMGFEYGITEQYLTKNGKPYIYRMGEMHYSRVPEDRWEEELIKMRDGGIDVISSYVIWIHHEEKDGEFCFDGNRNIAKFIGICKKLGLPFVLRIGPWCHAEVRNGGFPDWLIEKTQGIVRTDAEPYLSYVQRFFEQIYAQVKDCLDSVLAIQLENEMRKQKNYMIKLKKMLIDIGFFAPFYTITGWGGADSPDSYPENEMIPLYGGYPEAPWLDNIDEYFGCSNFLFSKERDDENIGGDLFGKEDKLSVKTNATSPKTPFLTCELGGGMQATYHRRPIISAEDIFSLIVCKLGSGTNGLGYYVYHGGANPVGETTMQESRETGYPNDLPIISYDFQAPLGNAGQIRKIYFLLRALHKFINSDGERLAPMPAVFPDEIPRDFLDIEKLRCAVRSDGFSGYLFVSNHYHGGKMKKISELVKISLADGGKTEIPVKLDAHAAGIIPFNYKIGSENVSWLTAMPQGEDENNIYFAKMPGIEPEICIDGKSIVPLTNGMSVGGKRLVIIDNGTPSPSSGKKIALSDPVTSQDRSFFDHIVNFDGTLPEFAPVNEYKFKLAADVKYLKIEAYGNVGALYCKDKLVFDNYLRGDDWIIDVRSFAPETEFVFKILPLTKKDKAKIFFEYDMPIGNITPTVYGLTDKIVYVD
ncbi:MAG: hypothetical protein E7656_06470 [Ruminococcaceae bacterium]|nr:hypothetical protein [Oscillospiraceae bacterium]